MRPAQIVIFAVALVATPLLATAETSKQSGAHHAPKQLTKADVAAAPTAPGWDAAYAEARADMLAGRFAAAIQKFEALLLTAPDPTNRLLVAELLAACRTWAQGGFVLASTAAAGGRAGGGRRRRGGGGAGGGGGGGGGEAAAAGCCASARMGRGRGRNRCLGRQHRRIQIRRSAVHCLRHVHWIRGGAGGGFLARCALHRSRQVGGKAVAGLTWGFGHGGRARGRRRRHVSWNNPWASRVPMGSAALWSGAVVGTLVGAMDRRPTPVCSRPASR